MHLTAIFESWHIQDGNYPPLHKGQPVNLSFEIELTSIDEINSEKPECFEHFGGGEYLFCGNVLKIYNNEDRERIIVIQADNFRFYFIDDESHSLSRGAKICCQGRLLLDHYIWVEFLDDYENAPDLFYNLRVQRITKVTIPERFINRYESGKSSPCSLKAENYSVSDTEELETMENQPFDEEFYVIEFDGTGLEDQNIKRTFLS